MNFVLLLKQFPMAFLLFSKQLPGRPGAGTDRRAELKQMCIYKTYVYMYIYKIYIYMYLFIYFINF